MARSCERLPSLDGASGHPPAGRQYVALQARALVLIGHLFHLFSEDCDDDDDDDEDDDDESDGDNDDDDDDDDDDVSK